MTLSRRTFIGSVGAAVATRFHVRLPFLQSVPPRDGARLAVITDLHHGLAPDALSRFHEFANAVARRRNLDATIQLGDFTYSDAGAAVCLDVWHSIRGRRYSLLGNHDMDRCDKAVAMKACGMPSRYWSEKIGGYRFIGLDLNHYKTADGVLVPYANGNYFANGVTHNLADVEQLSWLAHELTRATDPVVVLAHQPLGMVSPGEALPIEQQQVFDVIKRAGAENRRAAVVACISGHLHVDRLEHVQGIPCLCVNSASYFWHEGMRAYTKPLFAFMEFTADGELIVEGCAGEFVQPPPTTSDVIVGRSGSIANRRVPVE